MSRPGQQDMAPWPATSEPGLLAAGHLHPSPHPCRVRQPVPHSRSVAYRRLPDDPGYPPKILQEIMGHASITMKPPPSSVDICQPFSVVPINLRPGMIATRLPILVRRAPKVVGANGSHIGSQRRLVPLGLTRRSRLSPAQVRLIWHVCACRRRHPMS